MSRVRIVVEAGALGIVEVERDDYLISDVKGVERLIDEVVNQARLAYGLDAR